MLHSYLGEVIDNAFTNSPTLIINNKWHPLKNHSQNTHAKVTPKLIANCCDFITINNKVPSFLHKSFNSLDYKTMHVFIHLLTNGITPMFAWYVLCFQEIKQLLHVFNICQGSFEFQKPINDKRIEWTLSFFFVASLETHTNSPILFWPLLTNNHSLSTCWLLIAMKY